MPTISSFFGITIVMYWRDHNPPHFHAIYGECRASIGMNGELIEGILPRRAMSLVLEWLALHRSELLDNWQKASHQEPIIPIAPLE